jgi:hypothetical protein
MGGKGSWATGCARRTACLVLKVIESQYFAIQTKEDQTHLKSQLPELEKQRDGAKKGHEETVNELFKTGSWPVANPPPQSKMVCGRETQRGCDIYSRVEGYSVACEQLEDISMFKLPTPPPLFCRTILMMVLLCSLTMTMHVVRISNGETFLII